MPDPESTLPTSAIPPVPQPPATQPIVCPQCHQLAPAGAYFCPNCGKKLSEPGLSKSLASQLWLYAFSIILPFIGWLAITKWEGIKYARSNDPDTQRIGWIAIVLLVIFSIYVTWQAAAWINGFIQAQTSTAGLSAYGI